jgi:putative MATE family efflux protein
LDKDDVTHIFVKGDGFHGKTSVKDNHMASQTQKIQKRDMTKGDIMGHVIRMALPMTIGIGAIISFSLADTYFIGQLGATELAAIGYTFPVTTMLFNIVFGMAIAMSAVVSRTMGQGDRKKVGQIAIVGVTIAFLSSAFLSFLCYIFLDPLFRSMGAGDVMMPLIKDYMPIWLIGSVCLSIPVVINSALRGLGDAFWPAAVMVTVAVVNIILDPILIFGLFGAPRMEIQGAAVASLISYVVAMVAALSILIVREKVVSIDMLFCKQGWLAASKPLLMIAIPVSLANLITPVTSYGFTAMLSDIGDEAVAAFGVVSRIEAFALIPIMALAGGIAPLIGQNFGAGLTDRVNEAINKAMRFGLFYGIGCAVVTAILSGWIASIFSDNAKVIEFSALYLLFVPLSYFAMNIFVISTSAMNALNKAKEALVLNIVKSFVLSLPLVFVGVGHYGFHGFIAAIIGANIMCFVVYFYLKMILKRL